MPRVGAFHAKSGKGLRRISGMAGHTALYESPEVETGDVSIMSFGSLRELAGILMKGFVQLLEVRRK